MDEWVCTCSILHRGLMCSECGDPRPDQRCVWPEVLGAAAGVALFVVVFVAISCTGVSP